MKTDRYFYDEVTAAVSHPRLEVRVWGPGWEGYIPKLTSSENIRRTFPNISFDIIYSKTRHFNITSTTAVVIHGTADCHQHNCLRDDVYPTHADAITFRYAGLILEFARPEQWASQEKQRIKKLFPNLNATQRQNMEQPMPFFFHSPDCADDTLLHPIPGGKEWEQFRPHKIRLIGSHQKELYPLRYTIWKGIKSGKIKNAEVYEHVGNTLNKPTKKTIPGQQLEIGIFNPNDPVISHHRKNQQNWANVLATTQICVFDSSIVRKAIRKFQESFLSGCVVASDIPLEMEDIFRDVVIPLRVDMGVHEINEILQTYLQDTKRLRWMAREAFKRARMHLTCRNKVDRLLQAAAMVLRGERGYWFPFGFSATCRKFWTGDKYTTEWCRNNEHNT
ncbi:hypothetical protein BCR33DRAFT_551353 [Rhizoclosmatium globosum]|uniref:Glycosyl transferase CAP10 domain-containing protein n=1 Tax=Rhizoclosmatium globosum TaxID=329046 RepID=A0A1Y2B929_9FUNG|nr:hypothetical protein BCR33DRAFT_551353 [Rhizoclosmatium globosum]|eukprot:ORY31196.1 hypothetical protein BCR33DRAFT_551353 [Rhizoclosmatium globosum]